MVRRGLSIRQWLMLLVAAAAVPAMTVTAVSGFLAVRDARQHVLGEVATGADLLMGFLDRQWRGAVGSARLLAHAPVLQAGDTQRFHAYASGLTGPDGIAAAIGVIDRQGNFLLNTIQPFGTPLPKSGHPAVDRAFASSLPVLSDLYVGGPSGRLLYTVALPVPAVDGPPRSVLLLAYLAEDLTALLSRAALPEDWIWVVFDSRATAVAHGAAASRPILAALRQEVGAGTGSRIGAGAGRAGPRDVAVDGGERISAVFQAHPETGWTVVVAAPQAQLMAPVRTSIVTWMLLTAGVAGGGGLAAYVFARRLGTSIRRLGQAASRVGLEPLGALPPTGVRELEAVRAGLVEAQALVAQRDSERGRLLEAAQAAREAAEKGSGERSRLLAAASHDLRQPMQAALLDLEIARGAVGQGAAKEPLDRLETALTSLGTLLDDILDLSKLDIGVIRPALAPVPVGPVLARLAEDYRPLAGGKGLTVRVVTSEARVEADPVLLERVLRHLLDNAVAYTGAGGVLIGCRRRDGRVWIDVVDTGPGLSADRLSVLVEGGSRPAPAVLEDDQGLGLGLSMARQLIRLMGGRLEARSTVGRGSRFSVVLATPRPTVSPEAPSSVRGAAPERRILVVEDEPAIRLSLGAVLADWGWTVTTAVSGPEALEQIEDGLRPDVVMSDYRLTGGLDGITTLRRIRQVIGTPVPCLLLTGDTALPAQLADVVVMHKPIAMPALRTLVERLASARPAAMDP